MVVLVSTAPTPSVCGVSINSTFERQENDIIIRGLKKQNVAGGSARGFWNCS